MAYALRPLYDTTSRIGTSTTSTVLRELRRPSSLLNFSCVRGLLRGTAACETRTRKRALPRSIKEAFELASSKALGLWLTYHRCHDISTSSFLFDSSTSSFNVLLSFPPTHPFILHMTFRLRFSDDLYVFLSHEGLHMTCKIGVLM